jgi:flagellar biosynthesis protein FlhF
VEDAMKYVKIKAKDFNSALMELKMKYGEDAIPISHKRIKEGGFLNTALFAREIVELTAAIQEKGMKSMKSAPAPEKRARFDVRIDNDVTKALLSSSPEEDRPSFADELRSQTSLYGANGRKAAEPAIETAPVRKALPAVPAAGDIVLTKEEYQSLKKIERNFAEVQDKLEKLQAARDIDRKNPSRGIEEEEMFKPLAEILKHNDYDDSQREKMLTAVRDSLSRDDMKDKTRIEKTLRELVKSRIVVTGPIQSTSRRKVIMFVGPTGVGKTTSLAKLGAIFSLREGRSVAFVTIDTYRIAATEQLKKYADIMKIPVHVVADQKDFKAVMEKEKADIILVDTSGRSHRNALKISEIKSYADQVECDFEKILCVSAGTKREDVDNIFQSFEKIGVSSVMITKTDETSWLGNVISVADKYNKPISYLANGQEVPNDIMVADSSKIADMMFVGTQE